MICQDVVAELLHADHTLITRYLHRALHTHRGQHSHRDQRSEPPSTTRDTTCTTEPRLPVLALPRLADIAAESAFHIPRRIILADQIPSIRAVGAITGAIHRAAAHGCRRLPDQLGVVTGAFGELLLLVVVLAFFVGPGVDGEGWSRVVLCEVFAMRTILLLLAHHQWELG